MLLLLTPLPQQNMTSHKFAPEILRKYDIRGTMGKTLSTEDAYYLGRAYSSLMHTREIKGRVVVAYDGRISSIPLAQALIKGLNDSGVAVINIGLAATPVLYFATATLEDIAGGIMITGSHNPADQNGFKMIMAGKPLFDKDILVLGDIANSGDFVSIEINGSPAVEQNVTKEYINNLMKMHPNLGALKVVWDPGNGVVGAQLPALLQKLPGTHYMINEEVDGTFPNHHPNPSVVANLQQLIRKVAETGSDLGMAFDGDGDRLGVVDKKGNVIWGDSLLLIMAEDLLSRHPGAKIIADVKTGDWVFKQIEAMGGIPIIWKTGHSFIKTKMKEEGALLAGEMSGHLFFAENYYGFDDAIMAAVKLLSILSSHSKSLEEIVSAMPRMKGTPEISIPSSEERKFVVIEEMKAILKTRNISFVDIDGVRVPTRSGWWLVRASNTEANLILRVEADTVEELNSLMAYVKELLALVGVDMPASY